MQSKQQKQIKVFLIQIFGGSRGGSLFSRQEKMLDMLIKTAANRSKNQMKTLVQTILPRIALYKVLQAELPAGGNLYAHADVHDGLGGSRKARFHGENGVCAGILSDLQLLLSQDNAYLRLVGEYTGTR